MTVNIPRVDMGTSVSSREIGTTSSRLVYIYTYGSFVWADIHY